MNRKYSKGLLTASVFVITALSTQASFAGGFAISEQSAYYQGTSLAGAAAGDDLSSMYWNPAAAAARPGMNVESVATGIFANSNLHATGGQLAFGRDADSGNIGRDVFVPSSYSNYQVNDRLYLGLAMNSPFGLSTKPGDLNWAGAPLGLSSKLFTFDINPTLAYKLTPDLTIGVGPQIEYVNVRLVTGAAPAFGISGSELGGHAWATGVTAGLLWQPSRDTSLGLGYRSSLDVDADAGCHGNSFSTFQAQGGVVPNSLAPCNAAGSQATTKFTLPETVTLSLRQNLNERLAVLGTIEYTNHSSIQTIAINSAATGKPVDVLPLNFKDGWLYSIGAEYKYSPSWVFRSGFAYERSPVGDSNRLVILPDANRIWASVGASYKWSEKLSFDVGYTHLFFDDNATIQAANLLTATSNTSADILSVGVKYRLDVTAPLEPYK